MMFGYGSVMWLLSAWQGRGQQNPAVKAVKKIAGRGHEKETKDRSCSAFAALFFITLNLLSSSF